MILHPVSSGAPAETGFQGCDSVPRVRGAYTTTVYGVINLFGTLKCTGVQMCTQMVDMDMSMTGGEASADYSDYEYQTASLDVTASGSGNVNQPFVYQVEPLDGIGGLANNEVAELVSLEVHASIEPEDEKADQDIATAADLRGLVGGNLTEPDGLTAIGQSINPSNPGGSTPGGGGTVASEDRIFQFFQARAVLPFDDIDGPGGGSFDSFHRVKHFRNEVGRGPVLDSTDDVSVTGALIAGQALSSVLRSQTRLHMTWDVAEVSDAGREFSVP